MFSVALIGPDGSGKTTLANRLSATPGLDVLYLYLGNNPDALTHALPTTRLYYRGRIASGRSRPEQGPPDPNARRSVEPSTASRAVTFLKRAVWLLVTISEELNTYTRTRRAVRSGRIALLDRHPFWDYYAYDVTRPADLAARLHGWVLRRMGQPDVVVLLDAPAEVLWARKGEGTPALLEQRRQDYRDVSEVARSEVVVVDVSPELEAVVAEVVTILRRRLSCAASGQHG